MSSITELINKKGSWAARALVEDAIQRKIDGVEQDIESANVIALNSSGLSAKRYLKRYSEMTGVSIDNTINEVLQDETWCILDLNLVKKSYPTGSFSKIWLNKLLLHLGCSKYGLVDELNTLFINDTKPNNKHILLLKEWSWPFIQKLYDASDYEKIIDFKYIENDLAKFVWRKWYITNSEQLYLIDTNKKSNLTFGQWFVFRALHDATHLLHISTYPKQPKPTNPNWLITMEAFAINTEYEFYNLLEKGNLDHIPKNKDFNIVKIKTYLLLYLLDRALRVDFDLLVHLEKKSIEEWYNYVEDLTGLHTDNELAKEFLDITTEFHGLPGLGSAYFLGIEALKKEPDKRAIWFGEKELKYF